MSISRTPPPNLHFIALGAAGFVFRVTQNIVIKHARTPKSLEHEQYVYNLLETKPPCANIICTFLHLPDRIFLEYMAGGTLQERLEARQTRGPAHEFVRVNSLEPPELARQWMLELTRASAWLESFGLVHGDIRPPNLLLDLRHHLKLGDFDSVLEVGQDLEAGAPPYARLQGSEAGEGRGTFEPVGPRTEQFAIGSVFYYLKRGYEPYEDLELSGPEIVDLLQRKQFPETEANDTDVIIRNCWHGDYPTLRQLADEVRSLQRGEVEESSCLSEAVAEERRQECRKSYSIWKPTIDDAVAEWRAIFPT